MMRSKRQIVSGALAFLLFAVVIVAILQRQSIFDWWRLRGYNPTVAIEQLASDTTMNQRAQRLFFVYHPELENRNSFNESCPERGEKTIILGCYISNRGIHLFDVNDSRLNGVEQVTAAHELLHAAYDRLSKTEREHVDALLDQAYAQTKNERIKNTVNAYQQAGDDVSNELHSIMGTEVRDLPVELETYYKKYFDDRKKIVAFSEGYENEFTSREDKVKSLLKQMEALEATLKDKKTQIDTLEQELATEFDQLERDRPSVQNPTAFNERVNAYNVKVARYRQLIADYNQLVNKHNGLLADYNAVAFEENELIKAIDSRASSIPSE